MVAVRACHLSRVYPEVRTICLALWQPKQVLSTSCLPGPSGSFNMPRWAFEETGRVTHKTSIAALVRVKKRGDMIRPIEGVELSEKYSASLFQVSTGIYSNAGSGQVLVVTFSFVDIAVRHATSFGAIKYFVTT